MEFRTKVEIPVQDLSISHRSRILMTGSCFIGNIGKILLEKKFNVNLNPFGVLYNPLSISQSLRLLITNKKFTGDDIFEHQGLFHSFYHHSTFSDADKTRCLEKINKGLVRAAEDIRRADVLFITFGTSYVFRSKDHNMVVGNCHKLPASRFDRYRLSVDAIVDDWRMLVDELRQINPAINIIYTVSPIRHLKDGAHDNQLSKSALLLATDELIRADNSSFYFPSYEIVMDELRDYRFYSEDMIHPNPVTIKYIWERFAETYFNADTSPVIDEWDKICQALNHRPFNPETEEYKHFLRQTLLKLRAFNDKYPYICCSKEVSDLEKRL